MKKQKAISIYKYKKKCYYYTKTGGMCMFTT